MFPFDEKFTRHSASIMQQQNNDAPASLNDYEQQGTIEYYRSQHLTTTDTAVGQMAVFCDYGMMMLWLMAAVS